MHAAILILCMYLLYSSFFIVDRFFFFKQKTAYEMRISDWSSDVCSSDLCSDQISFGTFRRHARRNDRGECRHLPEAEGCGALLGKLREPRRLLPRASRIAHA